MVDYEELKKIVIVRLEAMSSNIKVSLGERSFSKEQMMNEVKNDTELGKVIVEMQLRYLRQMKERF